MMNCFVLLGVSLLSNLLRYTVTESGIIGAWNTSREYESCGTLLGDGRYCMNYSNRNLHEPPADGANITTILDLSNNKISKLDSKMFKNEEMLMILDLSNNAISSININVFYNLKSLQKVKLGHNRYNCDNDICDLRAWLLANTNKVEDLDNVTCQTPELYKDQKIYKLDIDSHRMCKNGTYNGFEINTGTVFLIWIVVPILITCFTALYILINGNNRFGRTVRNFCSRGTRSAPQPSTGNEQDEVASEAVESVESARMGTAGVEPAVDAEPVPGSSRESDDVESIEL